MNAENWPFQKYGAAPNSQALSDALDRGAKLVAHVAALGPLEGALRAASLAREFANVALLLHDTLAEADWHALKVRDTAQTDAMGQSDSGF